MHDPNRSPNDIRPSKLTYRKDIQGLRAVAILLVIAAHAQIPGFGGGFIGVDVFFVISGYLITGLLVKELTSNNRINFIEFYSRRLKRLLPALALVVIVSAFLAYRLLPPTEQLPQAISAASAIFWVSNLQFAFQDLDYFGSQAEQNIYLHTWSLGVEEQFYLVWPLLLTLAFWAAKSKPNRRAALVTALSVIGVSSLVACAWQTYQDARLSFYLMPFRAWQFCAGGLVFLLADKFEHRRNIDTAISLFGLMLIIGCAIFLRDSMPYPGIWAIIPTFGTALLLIAGGKKDIVAMLMENRIAQGIGNISYSLYLWHWPVFVLGGLILPLNNLTNQVILITTSCLLAYISYMFVENPIRFSSWHAKSYGRQIFGALFLMVIINIGAIRWGSLQIIAPEPSSNDWFSTVKSDLPEIYKHGCDDWFRSADVKICKFGADDSKLKAVIFGDSIGLQWFPAIHEIAKAADWQLLVMTKSACPMVNEPFFYPTIGREYTECAEWRANAIATITNISPDLVILGSAETYNFSLKQWQDGTESVLLTLAASASKIYFLRATPQLGFDGPNCLAKMSDMKDIESQRGCRSNYNSHEDSIAWRGINTAASKYQNVKLIDMNEFVCPQGSCSAYRDGAFIYRDGQHLTAQFVHSLTDLLRQHLEAQ